VTAGRWHELREAILASNLPASDKAVYRLLLDKADYRTADLPAKFTPTREAIARQTSLSRSQAGYATRHLARHGWLALAGAAGPGRPRTYTLAAGTQCDCTGRRHTVPAAPTVATPQARAPNGVNAAGQSAERDRETAATETVSTEQPNGVTGRHRSVSTNGVNAAGQRPLFTERHREGGLGEGALKVQGPPQDPHCRRCAAPVSLLRFAQAGDLCSACEDGWVPGLECVGGCGQPARRGCETCWQHAPLESTS
jgi:hypothetical protein